MTLDITIDDDPTFSKCDKEFRRLCEAISAITIEDIVEKASVGHPVLAAVARCSLRPLARLSGPTR